MRTMYDAASVGTIPANAQLVGYYVDGRYKASGADLSRFPHAVKVGIAVFTTTNAGVVYDGPPDNGTWPGVVDWVVMRRAAGVDPTVYTDYDQWSTGVAEFRARGVAQPHWWIAKWDGNADMIPGAVAHQYLGDEHGGYDTSVVADYWPGVDPAPPGPAPSPSPVPTVLPSEDDEMLLLAVTPDQATGNAPGIWLLSGPLYTHVLDPADLSGFTSAGLKQASISYAQHLAIIAAGAALKGSLSGSLGVSGTLNVQ